MQKIIESLISNDDFFVDGSFTNMLSTHTNFTNFLEIKIQFYITIKHSIILIIFYKFETKKNFLQ